MNEAKGGGTDVTTLYYSSDDVIEEECDWYEPGWWCATVHPDLFGFYMVGVNCLLKQVSTKPICQTNLISTTNISTEDTTKSETGRKVLKRNKRPLQLKSLKKII